LRLEKSEISLVGARGSNQDRVASIVGDQCACVVVCDGMGGHQSGEQAAEIASQTLCERFRGTEQPLMDPLGFLHLALGVAHERVVQFGAATPIETRPRATCALVLVQDDAAYWAHVGDSRVYHLRAGAVVSRTRDHSHVELLLREGLIERSQMQSHPMRNFVESCLGGELLLPEMSLSMRNPLKPGDIVLTCTDGLWGSFNDEQIAAAFNAADESLSDALNRLARRAVELGGVTADNTSAVALRYVSTH
jgi:serine/threonine protein phosphatase PrpC